ncbi:MULTISPECIES: STAS domain-containing protein [unclassified Streptomyces]|uniref:STAS domain-containing protein n=1 Tax=unclassified Streptomyces TaxID=2593676 RepID=UPI001BE4E8B2|nr:MULTISPECIES: STAS domain-containing protein [unclassified Streptomyces]MBT2408074.1 STAS domain-containing protein [Streptomyces sp. ISL-21]MBT2455775.1 STAS domain-containing protein [Streptomyces sp. ISL-86]MBT2609524.1 STAS domain-containing protein [Streptomyces sp. ISL-87]
MAVNAYGTSGDSARRRCTADVRWSGGAAVIVVAGEVDHDHQEPLRDALAEALARGARRIVVDCARMTFCDSTGLNVLLQSRLEARETGSTVELAALRPAVARMFDITGAKAVFTVHSELPDALTDRERP